MSRKPPSKAIETASESEDEMNEDNTTINKSRNIKEEITGDEEHTHALHKNQQSWSSRPI